MNAEVYWLAERVESVPAADDWLSARELGVLNRLHVPKRRSDWRLGRWTAKRAIAIQRGLTADAKALAEIEVCAAPSGVPEAFIGGRRAELAISLSHSAGMALCVLAPAGAHVGCDLEEVAAHGEAFLSDYFTSEEQHLVARCAAQERTMAVTLLWSAKESALKALGCGLRVDTRSARAIPEEVRACRCAGWRRISVRETGGRIFHGWWRAAADFIWTVVADPAPASPIALP